MQSISFISANYVSRALNYQGGSDWGVNDQATIAAASPEHFEKIAVDVAAAGFKAIDIWTAHCHWQHHAEGDLPEQVSAICARHGLKITSYAGGLNVKSPSDVEALYLFMERLGAPIFAGGIYGLPNDELNAIIDAAGDKFNILWGFENHPQKTTAEILDKVGSGRYPHCGIAIDTGWCGTQGLDALQATQAINEAGCLFIVHLKDVLTEGGHESCALGDGIVPVEAIARYLKSADWHGNICIEHEPYDHDPMPAVHTSLERVKQWLA